MYSDVSTANVDPRVEKRFPSLVVGNVIPLAVDFLGRFVSIGEVDAACGVGWTLLFFVLRLLSLIDAAHSENFDNAGSFNLILRFLSRCGISTEDCLSFGFGKNRFLGIGLDCIGSLVDLLYVGGKDLLSLGRSCIELDLEE